MFLVLVDLLKEDEFFIRLSVGYRQKKE